MAKMAYVERTLEGFLKSSADQFPVILLTGPRQVGKTTTLQQLSGDERAYVTLDDPLVLSLAKEDPALFMQRYRPPVFIDEIQYAPEILPFIKMEVDRERKPGLFWLSGSQHFHLMKGVSESLAGRVGIFNLLGLSRRESTGHGSEVRPFLPGKEAPREKGHGHGRLSLLDLYRLIWRGSLPAIALNPEMDRDLFYRSYVQTYLQRDVHDLTRVGDEMAFMRFLRAAASRTGQMLNVADLSRDADVSPNTGRNWLCILQASGIVFLLEPWHTNINKRLVKRPKLYFLDTGLCAWLTEWSSPETLEAGALSGPILETWIFAELLKSYWHNGKRAPFYYYRDKDQKEIDLLIEQDGQLWPLEFKKTASPRKDDVQVFATLERFGATIGPGAVVCLIDEVLPLTMRVQAIPVSAL